MRRAGTAGARDAESLAVEPDRDAFRPPMRASERVEPEERTMAA
jgi:hypothetical protein